MIENRAKWKFPTKNLTYDRLTDSRILDKLLVERGVTTKEAARQFLSPSLDDLESPNKLAMIDKASQRIEKAIYEQEKILIYGDYDADGVCSTALMLNVLKKKGAICDFFIPNRFEHGYGLHKDAIQSAYDHDFKVIITVDTGIAACDEVDFANDLGIDIIITDHHDIQERVPNAHAIIHPDYSPQYSFKDLAGVGVAFKFAEHMLGYFPKHLLDFVAIGTIADLVPLTSENRIFVKFGLDVLRQTKNKGLIALKEVCHIRQKVTEEDIGFRLGPRLNAVGRMQDADLAVHLLLSDNIEEARTFAHEIDQINEERKRMVRKIVEEAEQEISEDLCKEVIIVSKPGWHEGVLGIVASRLVQKYLRPAIVLTTDHNTKQLKGSARSIPSFHIFARCMEIRELFTYFGGHAQAAGMVFPKENEEKIKEHLNTHLNNLPDEAFQETINISQTLPVNEITEDFVEAIGKLAPFGIGNPAPVFHIRDIPQQYHTMGRNAEHLKLRYESNGGYVEGIGFGIGHLFEQISPQVTVEIVGRLGINEWNGFRNIQMIIHDLKIDEWQLFDHRGRKDFDPSLYIDKNKRSLMVIKDEQNSHNDQSNDLITYISYNSDVSKLGEVDQLFLYELPPSLDRLEQLVQQTSPKQIYVCFHVSNSVYLQSFPSRDDFKWLYAVILQEQSFDIQKKIPKIMRAKGWSKDKIIFMFQVFFELNFIKSNQGSIVFIPNPEKRDLQEAPAYQERRRQLELEKTLYYSNYQQLKELFAKWIYLTTKEETVNGF